MDEIEQVLRTAYHAFNARDVESAIALMHPDVDWPNAWEGGRIVGRIEVAEYWTRQFSFVSSVVEPRSFVEESDGSVTVEVHQIAHDARTGELLSEGDVLHRYRLAAGLITRMDVVDAAT